MTPQQQKYIQAQEFENEVRREVVRKLNPPVFEYEPIEQPYCPHWMRQMSKSGDIPRITWREILSVSVISALILTAYCYHHELTDFFDMGGRP